MLNPLWAAPVQIGQCVSRRAENSCGSHLPQAPARVFQRTDSDDLGGLPCRPKSDVGGH